MTREVIAIDVDDVIADSTEVMRKLVNERYNASLTPEHYKMPADYWGYFERVWEAHGLKGVSYNDLQVEMAVDQSHMPLLPGASFAIGELSKKYDIIVVTARNPEWERATTKWLNDHFGEVFSGVHFAGGRHGAEGAKTKGALCKELGAYLLIDDNIDHCRSALEVGLEAILFGDYGWHNRDKGGLTNCKDWPAVLEYFDGRSG